jgi:hypothetical protein
VKIFDGTVEDYIVLHGKPAGCLGDPSESFGGFPSCYHDTNGVVVMEFLIATMLGFGNIAMIPRSYGIYSALYTEGLIQLWPGETALREWRPYVYHLEWDGSWTALGSQTELAWRFGLGGMLGFNNGELDIDAIVQALSMQGADEKAEKLLRENLTPQQSIELTALKYFRVRGGATGNLYSVVLGDGFNLLDPTTSEDIRSYCFHPEYWIPHADTALATKFLLEDPELEIETLEEARSKDVPFKPPEEADPDLVHVRHLEEQLIE